MHKLLTALPLTFATCSLAIAQAAKQAADTPVEQAGMESVIVFGVLVVVGVVGFVVFMAKQNAKKDGEGSNP